MEIKKLLITRFSAMGDVAMCVPVIASLAEKYKDLQIYFVSRRAFEGMFQNMPDNVHFVGTSLDHRIYKGLKGLNRLYKRKLQKYKPDAYADFHDVIRTKYLRVRAFFSGIKTAKIDKGRSEKEHLIKHGALNCEPLKTTIERYEDVLKELGFEVKTEFKPRINGQKMPLGHEILKVCGEKTSKWIGFAPFAAFDGKILPIETSERLVKILSEKEDVKVFLFGAGKNETGILEDWASKYTDVVSVAGRLGGLFHELPLIAHLDCMISMDSANMHLASLCGTRAVSVWGATHPAAGFYGFGQDPDDAVQLPLQCRPCSVYGKEKCRISDQYKCLRGITAEMIVEKVFKE